MPAHTARVARRLLDGLGDDGQPFLLILLRDTDFDHDVSSAAFAQEFRNKGDRRDLVRVALALQPQLSVLVQHENRLGCVAHTRRHGLGWAFCTPA